MSVLDKYENVMGMSGDELSLCYDEINAFMKTTDEKLLLEKVPHIHYGATTKKSTNWSKQPIKKNDLPQKDSATLPKSLNDKRSAQPPFRTSKRLRGENVSTLDNNKIVIDDIMSKNLPFSA